MAVVIKDLITAMELLGISSLDEARPELVNASQLLNRIWRPDQPLLKSRL